MKKIHIAYMAVILLCGACAPATLYTVVTDPVGADILVDGKPMGKTPATIKVKFSENAQMVIEKKVLVVKLSGYKEKKEVLSCQNANTELKFQLVPEPAEHPVADVVSKSSTTPAQANQTNTKSEAATGSTGTAGKAVQAPSVNAVAPKPAAPAKPASQPVVKDSVL